MKCPICYKSLNPGKKPPNCPQCGWAQAQSGFITKKMTQKSILKPMILGSVGFLIAVFHLSKWGGSSLSVLYLKTAQITRLAGDSQHQKLLDICHKVKNYNCVESSLKSYYQSSKDPEHIKNLALLQLKRKKERKALESYAQYFSHAFDSQSAFNYAKLLDQFGQKESALEFYNKILNAQKTDSIHVNVVRNKIDLLVRMNRKDEASDAIEQIKSLTKEHDDYMKQEIKRWEDQIRG